MARKSPTLLFLAFVVICVPCLGQTVDTAIVGTVRDSTGASISGATLTVTSLATGIQKKAVTTASGEYSITYLIPGTYNVTIVASGFTSNQRTASRCSSTARHGSTPLCKSAAPPKPLR